MKEHVELQKYEEKLISNISKDIEVLSDIRPPDTRKTKVSFLCKMPMIDLLTIREYCNILNMYNSMYIYHTRCFMQLLLQFESP